MMSRRTGGVRRPPEAWRDARAPGWSGDPADAAYAAGLRLLAGRELSEHQVRERLQKRGLPEEAIDAALARLRASGAVDDRRVAAACARTDTHVKGHGRARVLRHLQAIGIDRDAAEQAVGAVLASEDEGALLARALARRLHGPARPITDPREFRRLHSHLVRQGFDPSQVTALLKARSKRGLAPDDES